MHKYRFSRMHKYDEIWLENIWEYCLYAMDNRIKLVPLEIFDHRGH